MGGNLERDVGRRIVRRGLLKQKWDTRGERGWPSRTVTTVKLETTSSSDLASGHFPAIDPRSVTKLPHVQL